MRTLRSALRSLFHGGVVLAAPVVVLTLAAGCSDGSAGDDSDGPTEDDDQVPFVIEDEGLGTLPVGEGGASCTTLHVKLALDDEKLTTLYTESLGLTDVPEIDWSERQGILAWVDSCLGEPVQINLVSLTSIPDHLIAEYVIDDSQASGDTPVQPFLLVSVERNGYASIEAQVVEVPESM